MAVSRRRLLVCGTLGAYAVVACSLITDYSLNGNSQRAGDGGDFDGTGPNDGADESTTVETGPGTDGFAPDDDAGPLCSETPCVLQVAPGGRATCALVRRAAQNVYC